MKLDDYLNEEGLTREQFALAVGATEDAVTKWINGMRKPVRFMSEIREVTNGRVTADDFWGASEDI